MGCSSLVVATTDVCDCEDNLDLDAAAGAAGEALYGASLLWRTQFSACSAVRWTLASGVARGSASIGH